MEETRSRSNSFVSSIFGRRRLSSVNNKPNRFKLLARHLSAEESEINKERLAALGVLMSAFYDDEDDASSDQDDLIDELQDIGYFITPKDVDSKTDLDSGFDESEALLDIGQCNSSKKNNNSETMKDNTLDKDALRPKCTPNAYKQMKQSKSMDVECSHRQSIRKRKTTV